MSFKAMEQSLKDDLGSIFTLSKIEELVSATADDFLGSMFEILVAESKQKLSNITQSMSRCAIDEIIEESHSLHGTFTTFGAENMAFFCLLLERAAKNSDKKALESLFPYFQEDMHNMIKIANQIIEKS